MDKFLDDENADKILQMTIIGAAQTYINAIEDLVIADPITAAK